MLLPRLDHRSLLIGAGVALLVAVPPAVAAEAMADRDGLDGSNWVAIPFFIIIIGFTAGGFVAARRQPHAPLAHGGVAALIAWAAVQLVGVLRRVSGDESISVGGLVFAAVLAASFGMIGGLIAHRRRLASHPRASTTTAPVES